MSKNNKKKTKYNWKNLFILETVLVLVAGAVLFGFYMKGHRKNSEEATVTEAANEFEDISDSNVSDESNTSEGSNVSDGSNASEESNASTGDGTAEYDTFDEEPPVTDEETGIVYMPGVTAAMSHPSYWISKQDDPDKVLADSAQIAEINKAMISTSSCKMYDLENYTEDDGRFGIVVRQTDIKSNPTNSLSNGDDANFDMNQLAGAKINEPVVIIDETSESDFYKVRTLDYEGWVRAEDVAICSDKEQWLNAWKFDDKRFLVITTGRIYMERNNASPVSSHLMLSMGTRLEIADVDSQGLYGGRAAYNSYPVYIPVRQSDGSYGREISLLPENSRVSIGYQELTERNIISTAFEMLGDVYGWGSSLDSEDCSGFIQSVYKTFGIFLPRDTDQQECIPTKKVTLSGMGVQDRCATLDTMPAGTPLYMSGHTVMYLGSDGDSYYCINASGSVRASSGGKQKTRSIMLCAIDQTRMVSDGSTWLSTFRLATVPWEMKDED